MVFKEFLIVLCATMMVKTSGESNISSYIRNISQVLCPFTNFCSTKTEISDNENITPCCSKCSCDRSTCYHTENCCPDIEPIPTISTNMICADTMTKFRHWLSPPKHNGYTYGIKFYYIVANCPTGYENEFVDAKCRGQNQTELDDFLWVSHKTNNVIYQNQYCAKCHGVENWVSWNLRSNCITQLIDSGFNNLTTVLLSDACEIHNEVPESKEDVSRRYQCYLPDITSCNVSGIDITFLFCYILF